MSGELLPGLILFGVFAAYAVFGIWWIARGR